MTIFLNSHPQWWISGHDFYVCCYHAFYVSDNKSWKRCRHNPVNVAIQTQKAIHMALTLKRDNLRSFESLPSGSLAGLKAWPSATKIGAYLFQVMWFLKLLTSVWLQIKAPWQLWKVHFFSFVSKSSFRTFKSSKNCGLLHPPCKLWLLFYFHLEKSNTRSSFLNEAVTL